MLTSRKFTFFDFGGTLAALPYNDKKLTTLLNVRVEADKHAAFLSACESMGTRHADVLRDLIDAAIHCHQTYGSLPRDIALTQRRHPSAAYEIPPEMTLKAAEDPPS